MTAAGTGVTALQLLAAGHSADWNSLSTALPVFWVSSQHLYLVLSARTCLLELWSLLAFSAVAGMTFLFAVVEPAVEWLPAYFIAAVGGEGAVNDIV